MNTLRRRAVWTFAGQALSSSSNFLVALWALATVTAPEFAAISLCLTAFLLIAQLGRALVSVPVLVLYSEEPGTGLPPAAGAALGASVGAGVGVGALVAFGAAALDRVGGVDLPMFLVLAGALPFLLYQDTLRHVCIARRRPTLAAASDGSWLVLQLAGFVLLSVGRRPSATAVLAVWAGAGALAGVWAGAVLGARPRIGAALGWLRHHMVLCRRLMVEVTVNSGSYYVVAFGIAALAGVAELGHLRAAQSLFGPASVLLLGGTVLGVPESVRARHDEAALRRFAVRLSAGLALVSLVAGAGLYAVLPAIGPRFFAGMEAPVRALLPALTLFGAGIGVSAGALAGVRARGEGAWIVRAQVWRGAVALAAGLPAAARFGANGGLWGLAAAECAFAVALWLRFIRQPVPVPEQMTVPAEPAPLVVAAEGSLV